MTPERFLDLDTWLRSLPTRISLCWESMAGGSITKAEWQEWMDRSSNTLSGAPMNPPRRYWVFTFDPHRLQSDRLIGTRDEMEQVRALLESRNPDPRLVYILDLEARDFVLWVNESELRNDWQTADTEPLNRAINDAARKLKEGTDNETH